MAEWQHEVADEDAGGACGKAKGCCPRCSFLRTNLKLGAGPPPPPPDATVDDNMAKDESSQAKSQPLSPQPQPEAGASCIKLRKSAGYVLLPACLLAACLYLCLCLHCSRAHSHRCVTHSIVGNYLSANGIDHKEINGKAALEELVASFFSGGGSSVNGGAVKEVKPKVKSDVKGEGAEEEAIPMMCVKDKDGNLISDANGDPFGGFKPSSKLLELQKIVTSIPKGDKVIIFSFFKSFLDLAEGMLEHEMSVSCERFDGDCSSQKAKSAALNRFRSVDGPRVLLATIHSGGVGLNITGANHVIFGDR